MSFKSKLPNLNGLVELIGLISSILSFIIFKKLKPILKKTKANIIFTFNKKKRG